MGPADSKSKLSQSIAEILGTAEPIRNSSIRPGSFRPGPFKNSLIYSSMALLAINPVAVNAVGLGAMTVTSQLGQPLNATIPLTIAAGESMPTNCIVPTGGNSGIGTPKNLLVSHPAVTQPGTYNLRVSTTNALHEPMYEISLLIDCPGTSLLLRQYVLMLDLPGMDAASPVRNAVTTNVTTSGDVLTVPVTTGRTTAPAVDPITTGATTATTDQRANRSLQSTGAPIPAGKTYRVSKGDTLSTIAARIDGRIPDTTWSVARLIFSTNSQAFIRNNPDLIKLGSVIRIPGVAELAELEKGRVPVVSAKVSGQTTTRPEPVNVPAPQPAPVPKAVTATRPEVDVTASDPQTSGPLPASGTQDFDISSPDTADEPVAELQDVTTATQSEPLQPVDAAFASPFLDELPTPAVEDQQDRAESAGAVTAPTPDPAPAVTATAAEDASGTVSSMFAVLFGLLLGALVSLAAFRRQLIDGVRDWVDLLVSLRGKRVPVSPPATADDHDDIDAFGHAFETAEAAAAFESAQLEKTEAMPVGTPAENTYIVESSEVSPTEQIEPQAVEPAIIDPGALDAPAESFSSPDDEMLAMLFNDSEQTFDGHNSEIFDPTGGVETDLADAFSEPTVEMPEFEDEQHLDPTMLGLSDEFDDELPTEQNDMHLDETAQMPESARIEEDLDELTVDVDVDGNEDLTQKLNEALNLLEDDFDEEFTASQLLERAEVDRSLDEPDTEIANDLESLEDKIDG